MKTAMKILSALAAVVGIVYVVATYGDKIVQWAKNLLASCPCCNKCEVAEEEAEPQEAEAQEAAAEQAAEAEAQESEAEVEIVVESNDPVAEEADFAE